VAIIIKNGDFSHTQPAFLIVIGAFSPKTAICSIEAENKVVRRGARTARPNLTGEP